MSANGKPKDKISSWTLLAIIISVIFSIMVFSGNFPWIYRINIFPCMPSLVDVEVDSGLSGFDYIVWADVIIENHGRGGTATVKCTLYNDSEEYVKVEKIEVPEQAQITHRVLFPEARFFSEYKIHVEIN